jgi:peptidase E
MLSQPTIIAIGGGGFSMEPENLALDRYILEQSGVRHPKVTFLPTASGDAQNYIERFNAAFATLDCRHDHLSLFNRTGTDLREHLLSRDVIYVGGGNCYNMLLIWRAHGIDAVLREAWQAGVLLAGLSAGSICWFEQGTTDSFGLPLRPLTNGLGFLEGSHCPHYDGESERRPTYLEWVGDGTLLNGLALDDGVAARFVGTEVVEVVSSRQDARAYTVTASAEGAIETPIEPRLLTG